MDYVAASNGKYQATVADALVLTPGRHYTAYITAEYAGLTGNWQLPLRAALREV